MEIFVFLTVSWLFCTDQAPIFKTKVPLTIRSKDLSRRSTTLIQFWKTPRFSCVARSRLICQGGRVNEPRHENRFKGVFQNYTSVHHTV